MDTSHFPTLAFNEGKFGFAKKSTKLISSTIYYIALINKHIETMIVQFGTSLLMYHITYPVWVPY